MEPTKKSRDMCEVRSTSHGVFRFALTAAVLLSMNLESTASAQRSQATRSEREETNYEKAQRRMIHQLQTYRRVHQAILHLEEGSTDAACEELTAARWHLRQLSPSARSPFFAARRQISQLLGRDPERWHREVEAMKDLLADLDQGLPTVAPPSACSVDGDADGDPGC